jgi:anthranilate synthase/aminodeoxychorismate synthase-like glutamine amidotransferase
MPVKVLLLDNYDSFTYNLYDYLLQAGADCEVVRNDAIASDRLLHPDFDALVLSPGPGRPEDAGIMMTAIEACHQHLPIFGICLGHQALGTFFGARLVKAAAPMHGKTSIIRCADHPLFRGIPQEVEVMRYHSLLLESLDQTPLTCIATTDAGEIMALSHRSLPLWGVQFHPESILTDYGLRMVQNWVDAVQNTQQSACRQSSIL